MLPAGPQKTTKCKLQNRRQSSGEVQAIRSVMTPLETSVVNWHANKYSGQPETSQQDSHFEPSILPLFDPIFGGGSASSIRSDYFSPPSHVPKEKSKIQNRFEEVFQTGEHHQEPKEMTPIKRKQLSLGTLLSRELELSSSRKKRGLFAETYYASNNQNMAEHNRNSSPPISPRHPAYSTQSC